MPTPSLEADLRAAREAAGVSVDEIQQETRIPADVVQRFEAGKLLNDPAFNDVYIKAFLRAYARAVGLSPGDVSEAYSATRAGTYRGLGVAPQAPAAVSAEDAGAPDLAPEEGAEAVRESPGLPEDDAPEPTPEETEAPPPKPPAATEGTAPAVAALAQAPEPEPKPRPAAPPPEPSARSRVGMPAARSAGRSLDRSWGTIIGATVVVVLVVAGVLWLLLRDPAPEPASVSGVEADTVGAEGAPPADTLDASPPAPAEGPPLALPIRVTVLAGGDGLQAFRTTEIPDARRPYWVEPGNELTFESDEGVILWGEGAEGMDPSEVTIRWQGFEWAPQPGEVLRITPANGQRLLDSLQTAGARRLP
ncbi:MAG: helix-turn-helix transcriptional regulator [Rubricoccaceae bacterium]|nr:helix-turn-helix transcriptional regulator [Rubricoccaceae bacterium]